MRKYFITGLIILMPVALTLFIMLFLFNFFTTPFVDLVKEPLYILEKNWGFQMPENIALFVSRILALIFLFLFVFLLGVVARWFLIKNFLQLANRILSRIPLVKTIYKVTYDIISALFSTDGKKAFKTPVIVPFPKKPSYCLGFEAGEVAQEIRDKVKTELVSVFTPTAPHPISGFLFLIPKEDVQKIEMTNEEVIKFLVSCGMIYPGADK